MGRKKKWPPTVHFHKASGQDRVRIGDRDHYLGRSGSDEAKAAYARLVADLAAGRPRPAAPALEVVSVADVVAEWWAGPGARYGARGREAPMFRRAFTVLLRLYGPTAAADFRADELETLRMAMATGSWMTPAERARSRQPRWCAGHANRMCGRIKTCWRWAERKGHVPEGRWAHLCALPGLADNDASVRHAPDARACTWDELQQVLACCVRPVKAMLLLQWHTGMRSGEVTQVRPCDLDRAGEVWVYRPATHKNDWRGHSRLVPLGPEAQKILTPLLLECGGEEYVFRPVRRRTKDRYDRDSYAQAVRRAAAEAGVPGFHGYQCRHAAKARIAKEMGMEAARVALGQKCLESTAGYATQLDLTHAAEVAKRLG